MKTDDIDELFREAAEKYHIDTEKAAAWDDVYEAVHGDKPAQPPTPNGGNKKRWLNLLWLLLIPLGWFAHNVWNNWEDNNTLPKQQLAANKNDNNRPGVKNDSSAGNTVTLSKPPTPAGNSARVENSSPVSSVPSVKKAGAASTGSNGIQAYKQMLVKNGIIEKTTTQPNQFNSSQRLAKTKEEAKVGLNSNTILPQSQPNAPVAASKDGADKTDASIAAALQQVNPAMNEATDSSANAGKNKKEKKANASKEHYFYAGLMASPDVSFIHGQKTSPVGVTAGILLGYQFNKHISVETGVLFEHKNYYTKGDYLDKSKLTYFQQHPEIIVNSLDGNCKMIEIPVNFRYTFSIKNKNKFFGVVGMSSYLMGHEYYNYDYTQWGNRYTSGRPYDNHIKNWFSIANLSIGYERSIGNKTNLRIEPFIKVPVSGVGTGNLAITSTGLYIGITRRIP